MPITGDGGLKFPEYKGVNINYSSPELVAGIVLGHLEQFSLVIAGLCLVRGGLYLAK